MMTNNMNMVPTQVSLDLKWTSPLQGRRQSFLDHSYTPTHPVSHSRAHSSTQQSHPPIHIIWHRRYSPAPCTAWQAQSWSTPFYTAPRSGTQLPPAQRVVHSPQLLRRRCHARAYQSSHTPLQSAHLAGVGVRATITIKG
jgi:hypothetical protein